MASSSFGSSTRAGLTSMTDLADIVEEANTPRPGQLR